MPKAQYVRRLNGKWQYEPSDVVAFSIDPDFVARPSNPFSAFRLFCKILFDLGPIVRMDHIAGCIHVFEPDKYRDKRFVIDACGVRFASYVPDK